MKGSKTSLVYMAGTKAKRQKTERQNLFLNLAAAQLGVVDEPIVIIFMMMHYVGQSRPRWLPPFCCLPVCACM